VQRIRAVLIPTTSADGGANKITGKKMDRRLELQVEGSRKLEVSPRATDCSGTITRMT